MRKKGYEIRNPSNPEQGYRLTRDVSPGDNVLTSDFEPFGGADMPIEGELLPDWLAEDMAVDGPPLGWGFFGGR
jgi:hypothetical protein